MATEITYHNNSTVSLVDFMGGDDTTAMSAWVSYNRDHEYRLEDRKHVAGLLNFLLKNQHMTPFESSVFTFRIETPIFVAREFFRHRSASYSEMSGRYTEMVPAFYVPDTQYRPVVQTGKSGDYEFIEGTRLQNAASEHAARVASSFCWGTYIDLLEQGVAKEVARMVLPLNIFTQFYVTMNARNLMHFLELRSDRQALYEIREVAGLMEEYLMEKMPLTYTAWRQD